MIFWIEYNGNKRRCNLTRYSSSDSINLNCPKNYTFTHCIVNEDFIPTQLIFGWWFHWFGCMGCDSIVLMKLPDSLYPMFLF